MKKYFAFLLMLLFSGNLRSQAQTSDSTLNHLLAVNESSFRNKPLDSIIAILPTGYSQMKVSGWRKTARYLTVSYPNKVWLELHVRTFDYMNPIDPNHIWDINLMTKESLHHISISKEGACYYGCPDY